MNHRYRRWRRRLADDRRRAASKIFAWWRASTPLSAIAWGLSLLLVLGGGVPLAVYAANDAADSTANDTTALTTPQLFFPTIASASYGQTTVGQPVSATALEAADEFAALRHYIAAYKATQTQMTVFGQWRQSAWASNPVDTAYYRTVCNTAAVGAMVKLDEPTNGDVDLVRAKAILLAVIAEYDNNPYTPSGPEARDGWGFPTPNNDAVLNFDTGFVGYPCLIAAMLLWPQLDANERLRVRTVLTNLTDRLYQYRAPSFFDLPGFFNCGNSPAEEVSALASFLAAMSQFHRHHAAASAWQTRAQQLMDYAFNKTNNNSLNLRGGCLNPSDGGNYNNTVTNHNMYPHSVYGLSVLNDVARAVLPWSAQGVTIPANPVNNISSLAPGLGNDKLYGQGGWGAQTYVDVYLANLAYVNGVNSRGAMVTSDFSLRGITYNALNLSQSIDFRQKDYLGTVGVSDWGFGADFQNAALAFIAWADMTAYPTLGIFYYNYTQLRQAQAAQGPSQGYLPKLHGNGCAGPFQSQVTGWGHGFLASACNARLNGILVPFFSGSGNHQLSNQVNAHFFLNSFSAFNHLVAYLYMRNPLWPPDSNGNSTLPNLGS